MFRVDNLQRTVNAIDRTKATRNEQLELNSQLLGIYASVIRIKSRLSHNWSVCARCICYKEKMLNGKIIFGDGECRANGKMSMKIQLLRACVDVWYFGVWAIALVLALALLLPPLPLPLLPTGKRETRELLRSHVCWWSTASVSAWISFDVECGKWRTQVRACSCVFSQK